MKRTSSTPLSDRELRAWTGLLAAHQELVHRLDVELESLHGLPLGSYEVLMHLADAEGERLRMGELADRLLLSRSGITRLIDRLERQRLVERERCEDDARGLFAKLTPAGRRKVTAARPDHLAGVRRHFHSRLGGDEQELLARIWERLLDQASGAELDEAADGRPVR